MDIDIAYAPPPTTNVVPIDDPGDGGGGDGGGGNGPRSWWEDTNGNGVPDGYFTDQNGDGVINVGDSVQWAEDAFIYEQTANEYTAEVFEEGFQDWASDFGWQLTIAVGAGMSGIDMPGLGGVFVDLVSAGHDLIFETFGMIDWDVMSHIATDEYSDYFDTYNPYEDDS